LDKAWLLDWAVEEDQLLTNEGIQADEFGFAPIEVGRCCGHNRMTRGSDGGKAVPDKKPRSRLPGYVNVRQLRNDHLWVKCLTNLPIRERMKLSFSM
jgi:hypothetical protein